MAEKLRGAVQDPVCKRWINLADAFDAQEGQSHYFCGEGCKRAFDTLGKILSAGPRD